MDIGTAKPSAAERALVTHHLIDVVGVNESFDAARFVHSATAAIQDIEGRNRTAILCGGTGLYFNAWLGGLGSAPPPDPLLRAELEAATTAELLRNWPAKIRSLSTRSICKIDAAWSEPWRSFESRANLFQSSELDGQNTAEP